MDYNGIALYLLFIVTSALEKETRGHFVSVSSSVACRQSMVFELELINVCIQ